MPRHVFLAPRRSFENLLWKIIIRITFFVTDVMKRFSTQIFYGALEFSVLSNQTLRKLNFKLYILHYILACITAFVYPCLDDRSAMNIIYMDFVDWFGLIVSLTHSLVQEVDCVRAIVLATTLLLRHGMS